MSLRLVSMLFSSLYKVPSLISESKGCDDSCLLPQDESQSRGGLGGEWGSGGEGREDEEGGGGTPVHRLPLQIYL